MKIRISRKRIVCLVLMIIGALMMIPILVILFGVQVPKSPNLLELIAVMGLILYYLGFLPLILSKNKPRVHKRRL